MSDAGGTVMPGGWILSTLGEACRWGSGGTPRSGEVRYYGGNIPWVVIGDLNDSVVSRTAATITEEGLTSSSAKWVEEGSVLVAMYGSIGKLGIAGRRLTTNQAIAFARSEAVENRYLFWYLASIRHLLQGLGKGGTQQNISQTVLKAIPIPIAPLAEQRRIIAALEEHLSELDAAVAGLERARANTERYTASVLYAASQGRLMSETTPTGQWERVRLETLVADGRKTAYGVLQPGPDVSGGVPLVRVGDIQGGRISTGVLKRIAPEIAAAYPRTKLRGGELLISLVGTIGRTAVVPLELAGANTARAVGVVPLAPRVRAEWLNIWFRSPDNLARMNASAHEVARKTLNLEDVRAVEVAVPPLDVQDAIVVEVERRLGVAGRTAGEIDVQLARAARLRQGILKRAFDGKLVSQVVSDEPASELLARLNDHSRPATPRAVRTPVGHARSTAR